MPPLSDAAWQEAFEKYKQIPQYEHVNRGMSLAAFKLIYWWEWTHRFLGRLIGVVFLVPFIYFLAAGQLARPLIWRLAGIFALGGLQGFIGWYMVASGLGVSVLPRDALTPRYHSQLVVPVPFTQPTPSRRIALAYRRSFPRPEAIAAIRGSVARCRAKTVTPTTSRAKASRK